jgi:hypothetical protein
MYRGTSEQVRNPETRNFKVESADALFGLSLARVIQLDGWILIRPVIYIANGGGTQHMYSPRTTNNPTQRRNSLGKEEQGATTVPLIFKISCRHVFNTEQ